MKKIVLISVGQPSTNPRLVKEANSLEKAGFDVYVIYTFWNHWATEADKHLFSNVGWTPILVGGSPFVHTLRYLFTRVRVRLFMIVAEKITFKFGIAEIAKGRTYPELLKKAKSIKADLYIAHILAALPAAVNAARKNNAKSGFDVEDFHRQEVTDDSNSFDFKLSKYLEDKYLPLVDYITASSPLIAEQYTLLYKCKATALLNVFPKTSPLSVNNNNKEPLRLFWFSQTIGLGRGINDAIKALLLINNLEIELHLLGLVSYDVRRQLETTADNKINIFFYQPISPDDIVSFASQFDIGLALEESTPLNRDICLTNKIFTYMSAGLAIIASDTTAQKELLEKYPGVGEVYVNGNLQMLAAAIQRYFDDRDHLFQTKKASYNIARSELNWEKESEKFLKVISDTLSV